MFGKKKKRVNREAAWAARKTREAAEAKRRAGRATHIAPASISFHSIEIEEDHRHEQFFFSQDTLSKVLGLLQRFQQPLLLCAPSVGIALNDQKQNYLLLDRDTRFAQHLAHFQEFNLLKPFSIDFDADVLFIDPPFANVTPLDLAKAATMLVSERKLSEFPILIGYNRKRAEELASAFIAFGHLRPTTTIFDYRSGVMTDAIILFANDAAIQLTGLVVANSSSSKNDN
eukprot:CAMPEP_0197302804 /NCGR_PEP_ID=MMETSP0890-20130614/51282_1 /TAXON_ID=44058 ORGANISM="Aureoumbra lagunensis, Strain CCMP1510" /NCGR_SAMPLE_ID=MMETSP0890 /ASSEMBLY_ACC=CAM_ASM_000533 /LENGTH=228 /DNA_ID=CAMNT_0042782503 /DNA_START=239 /DNA_END=925 /DNA_ORIENTATION=-